MKKQKNIGNYIFNEYVFNNDKLQTDDNVLKYMNLLIDNNLATCISGVNDMEFSSSINTYKLACKKMCKWNKENKKFLINSDLSRNVVGRNKVDANPTELKYAKWQLSNGIYYAELDSKKTDEFAILQIETADFGKDTKLENETIQSFKFYFVGKKCSKNRDKFLDEYNKIQEESNKIIPDMIKYSNGLDEKKVSFKPFDRMIFSNKDEIMRYIDNWYENIPKFYEYGITPKLSILLHGEPGTGKTSFCRALAKYFDIHNITSISPNYFSAEMHAEPRRRGVIDDEFMTEKYLKTTAQSVYSIDDIDCIGNSRDTDKSLDNSKIISSLLEFLDTPPTFYMKANDGKYYQVAIVCATTNYYDRLDSAVKRFGRFDLTIEMGRFNIDEAEQMCALYNLTLKDVYKEKYDKSTTFSPAQIQALCMENIDKNLKNKGE